MSKHYYDVIGDAEAARREAKADGRAERVNRWDSDAHFWRIDTWTPEELADNERHGYYLANVHRRGFKDLKGAK